jgi:hypothetical protein
MMQSSFYQEIFHDGEIKGRAEALIDLLTARVGELPKEVEQRILSQAERNPRQIGLWFAEAVLATDAEATLPLIRKISAI